MADSKNGTIPKTKPRAKPRSRAKTTATATTSANTASDEEKCKMIQQQLLLFMHAFSCQRKENGPDGHRYKNCNIALCKSMKEKLNHLSTCQEGIRCPVPDCAMSRQILDHWKDCTNKNECMVCSPLNQDAAKPPPKPKRIDWRTVKAKTEWTNPFSRNHRDNLSALLVQGILASVDPLTITEDTLNILKEFSNTIEALAYSKAKSNQEYYHLLVEKTYQIQKCVDEKALKKKKQTKPMAEILKNLEVIKYD